MDLAGGIVAGRVVQAAVRRVFQRDQRCRGQFRSWRLSRPIIGSVEAEHFAPREAGLHRVPWHADGMDCPR